MDGLDSAEENSTVAGCFQDSPAITAWSCESEINIQSDDPPSQKLFLITISDMYLIIGY